MIQINKLYLTMTRINNNIDLIKNALKKQMANMVRWTESIKTGRGTIKKIIEIGPGKVLSGLISRISNLILYQ